MKAIVLITAMFMSISVFADGERITEKMELLFPVTSTIDNAELENFDLFCSEQEEIQSNLGDISDHGNYVTETKASVVQDGGSRVVTCTIFYRPFGS